MSQILMIQAIQKQKNHRSIQMIEETLDSSKRISFDIVSSDSIFKEIVALDTKKLRTAIMYQPRLLFSFSIFVSNNFNESVISGKFLF